MLVKMQMSYMIYDVHYFSCKWAGRVMNFNEGSAEKKEVISCLETMIGF